MNLITPPTEIEIAELINLTGSINELTTTARRLAIQRDRLITVLISSGAEILHPVSASKTFANELESLADVLKQLPEDVIPGHSIYSWVQILETKAKQIKEVLK